VLGAVVGLLTDATSVHACFVYLVEDEDKLVLAAAPEPYSELVGQIVLERGEGLAWWAAERKEPAWIREGLLDDPRTKYVPELEEERFQSLVCVPIVGKDGNVIGVISSHTRAPREFTEAEVDVLVSSASLVAGAIENARLYAEIEEHNRELEARVARRTAQLADATEEAQAARASAESASATKSQFLANVSHELRTPLTSVVGFTKIVRKRLDEVVLPALAAATDGRPADPKLDRAVRQIGENLAIMVAEGDRLTTMINDVLDLEKIEAGRMEFRREPLEIVEVVDQATAATAALFETTGLELRREMGEGIPRVAGDRHRLIQVVINLLSNAVKFTPGGGSVTVQVGATEGQVVVSVIDTGTGIPPEDQARVFEVFAQSGVTPTDKPRGTGLGLPISRQIVEQHGGRLWLESRVGVGSTFSFSLPAAAE
jgi:signal transduction histidine kinase